MNKTKSIHLPNILIFIFFLVLDFVMLYPFWYVLMYSLSSNTNIINSLYLQPNGFTLINYQFVFNNPSIFSGYQNSLFITITGTALSLILTGLTAYPLSRPGWPARKIIFSLILFTMLFYGGMIPTFLIIKSYGLVNTLWALILPVSINVFNLLVMVRFFSELSQSLIDSAKIDGCTDIVIFFRIVLPLSKAVFAAIGLFYAVTYWNEFMHGLIYLNDKDKYPIQVILYNMVKSTSHSLEGESPVAGVEIEGESIRMAVTVATILPIMIVYPFLQKHFAKGVMLGSVKG